MPPHLGLLEQPCSSRGFGSGGDSCCALLHQGCSWSGYPHKLPSPPCVSWRLCVRNSRQATHASATALVVYSKQDKGSHPAIKEMRFEFLQVVHYIGCVIVCSNSLSEANSGLSSFPVSCQGHASMSHLRPGGQASLQSKRHCRLQYSARRLSTLQAVGPGG